jgi:hypothetical protein
VPDSPRTPITSLSAQTPPVLDNEVTPKQRKRRTRNDDLMKGSGDHSVGEAVAFFRAPLRGVLMELRILLSSSWQHRAERSARVLTTSACWLKAASRLPLRQQPWQLAGPAQVRMAPRISQGQGRANRWTTSAGVARACGRS